MILIAERIRTERQDWILTPKEFAEDAFWLATSGLIWVPFYSNYYKTPISEGLKELRDVSRLNFELQPESLLGLILVTIILRTLIEFIYYWLHRIQHKFLFWWRIHATHHYVTKIGAYLNHSNLPFRSGFYGLYSTTAEQHHLHHSYDRVSSDSNLVVKSLAGLEYLVPTSGREHLEKIGAGTGKALVILVQYKMAFVCNNKLTRY